MRILHIIPDIGISNGIMSVILNFAKAMPNNIVFDVAYFCETTETRRDDIIALGGSVYKIDTPSISAFCSRSYKKFFNDNKGKWEVVHIHAPHFAVFIAPFAKNSGINKICVHSHSNEFSLKGNSRRNKILSLYSKYFITDKFACSDESGKFWYGNKRFTVLKNAIDCSNYQFDTDIRNRKRKELEIDDKFVIGHIGRTDITQKNHPFIIKVFNALKNSNSNSHLLLIGATPTNELNEQLELLGLKDCVSFLGFRNDINELLMACDVFLFPSISEGLPVSLVEAQAASLPIVMSDTITNEVIVSDKCVCLSLNESPQQWAETALKISSADRISNYQLMKKSGWEITEAAKLLINYYNGN